MAQNPKNGEVFAKICTPRRKIWARKGRPRTPVRHDRPRMCVKMSELRTYNMCVGMTQKRMHTPRKSRHRRTMRTGVKSYRNGQARTEEWRSKFVHPPPTWSDGPRGKMPPYAHFCPISCRFWWCVWGCVPVRDAIPAHLRPDFDPHHSAAP